MHLCAIVDALWRINVEVTSHSRLQLSAAAQHKGRVPKGIITLILDQKYEVNAYSRIDGGIKGTNLYTFLFQFRAFQI